MRFRVLNLVVLAALSFAALPGCNRNQSVDEGTTSDPQALLKRGRMIYQTNCTACHHSDPNKAGSLGPEVFGSSLELLEARIMRGTYPEGYKPKRDTKSMVPLPHLEKEIPALFQYLNSSK